MPKQTRPGFVIANSDNVPNVDCFMLANFFNSISFPEARNVKVLRSGRANYGDNAIGFVELKREGGKCELWAQITPEHKVSSKPYELQCIVDEKKGVIEKAKCESVCPAKEDCCKHAIAFLEWLSRESQKPSRTSVESYWNRPALATIGRSLRFMTVNDIESQKKVDVPEEEVQKFFEEACAVLKVKSPQKLPVQLSCRSTYAVHHLLMDFKKNVEKHKHSADSFLRFCSSVMTSEACESLAKSTCGQAESTAWFSLRCSRVTASKIYEASKCSTADGSLVNRILGVVKIKENFAMKRGRTLESWVLKTLKPGRTLKHTGFVMKPEDPIFGASPDALISDYVIEVKCPMNENSYLTYFENNDPASKQPAKKHLGQLTLQMLMCNKRKGLFLVADPNFEENNKVCHTIVNFDEEFSKTLMKDAKEFWKKYVYPVLYDSV